MFCDPNKFYVNKKGFTLIELLVTITVVSLIFGGLFLTIQSMLKLVNRSKSMTGALAAANEKLEYIRSLSYTDIGTQGGIPYGNISQTSTTTLNGIIYYERVVIQYVDSDDDGTGTDDSNGILADYKQVKVEYSWNHGGSTSTVFLLTNIVPPGIESVSGGGTLTVNVFDAEIQPVSGASVRVYNDTASTTIDTTRLTNSNGIAVFAGAPAVANYEIDVTKLGHSLDKTYSTTIDNSNPITPHVAVLESQVSTMNFQIDELSNLLVRTVGPDTSTAFIDNFNDMSLSTTTSNVVTIAGELVLSGGLGAYAATGTIFSVPITPINFIEWESIIWDTTVPASTTLAIRLYSVSGGVYTIIPDTDMLGNSTGFTSGLINISGLDIYTYPSLAIGATLTSEDVDITPAIQNWSLSYIISEPSIASVPLVITGNKIIGYSSGGAPVYKYEENHTTDGSGEISLVNMEWDMYSATLSTGAYDIAEGCPSLPHSLNPSSNETITLTLVPASTNTLRVTVVDYTGAAILGANVTLSRSGYNDTLTSSTCGQVFFNSGISTNTDYQVEAQAGGYSNQTVTEVEIDGDEILSIILSI